MLSTLHTNSAVGAVTRLRDMGVEPFLLSSSLLGVLAQRLVRVLCTDCREAHTATAAECRAFGQDPAEPPTIHRPAGCESCHGTGYSGRTGIYELLSVDEAMRGLIHENAGEQKLLSHARAHGPSIRADGWREVVAGTTSIEEVLRVTQDE